MSTHVVSYVCMCVLAFVFVCALAYVPVGMQAYTAIHTSMLLLRACVSLSAHSSSCGASHVLRILLSLHSQFTKLNYGRTRLVEDPPLVNLAAHQTLRKVRRTNRILAIVFSSNYNLLSDAVRPPQTLLSKTICSSHSSSGVLPVSSKFCAVQPHLLAASLPPRRPHGPAFLWRHRGPLEVLAVQPLFWRPRLLRRPICHS